MEIETIRAKRDEYERQRQEVNRQRAELARMLEQADLRAAALLGAVQALDDLLQGAETKG